MQGAPRTLPRREGPGRLPPVEPCPFCAVAAGAADPDLVVVRTPGAFVLPVPDQRPRNRGHVLVLLVLHLTRLADVEPALLGELFALAGRVSAAMRTAFGASGATIFENDGSPDQVLQHIHVHVVPRSPGDGFRMPDPAKEPVDRAERLRQAEALRRALAS